MARNCIAAHLGVKQNLFLSKNCSLLLLSFALVHQEKINQTGYKETNEPGIVIKLGNPGPYQVFVNKVGCS